MNTLLWILAWLLALAFLAAGVLKLAQPTERLAASGLTWVEDFSPAVVKLIGALEVLGAIGLVLPALLDVAPVLVPLAATGFVLLMAGAVVTHVRRSESLNVVVNLVLMVPALVVAWGRFGPHAF